jgi:hypothetical protein
MSLDNMVFLEQTLPRQMMLHRCNNVLVHEGSAVSARAQYTTEVHS